MTDAVIVDAIRTPGGKRNGKLKDWHPVDLAAHVLKALQERNDLDPALVDDVVMGCVMQVGPAVAQHRAQRRARRRLARVGAGDHGRPPVRVEPAGAALRRPGCDRRCYDVVVAAGVEVMTRTPMGSSVVKELGFPFPKIDVRPLRRDRVCRRRASAPR